MNPTTSGSSFSSRPDPVLAEVRRAKVMLLERFGFDLKAMAEDARKRQGESGHVVIDASAER
ncbi:hypothetical protein OKA05_20095 [Luteolibacter arcticus]|uniref:Uncharacterized protein n=1 Tax=Luteolibacter arcticus TaxID=1581411 RepID=A0ABT3GN29_9BACT|nr:hypothetical protein [Luteolibacter arcticus]MCW1924875.1 hypothetical protein [Luteolibacter arcticus]